jgi:hypothetical protein
MLESREGTIHGIPEQTQENNQSLMQFVFFNPDDVLKKSQQIALSIFVFCFGAAILFLVNFFVLRDLVFDSPAFNINEVLIAFFAWPFSVAGGNLMVYSFFLPGGISDNWAKITFLPSKIIIEQEEYQNVRVVYSTLLELSADQIANVTLIDYTDKEVSKSSRFKLKLVFSDIEGKNYSLGNVMKSERMSDILTMKRALERFVKKHYTFAVNNYEKRDKRKIRKALIISLITTIFHFTLWSASILIAYFII